MTLDFAGTRRDPFPVARVGSNRERFSDSRQHAIMIAESDYRASSNEQCWESPAPIRRRNSRQSSAQPRLGS
jgi:hypothetical protein